MKLKPKPKNVPDDSSVIKKKKGELFEIECNLRDAREEHARLAKISSDLEGKILLMKKEIQDIASPEKTFGAQVMPHVTPATIHSWIYRLKATGQILECILMSPITLMACGFDLSKPIMFTGAYPHVHIVPCESVIEGMSVFVGKGLFGR